MQGVLEPENRGLMTTQAYVSFDVPASTPADMREAINELESLLQEHQKLAAMDATHSRTTYEMAMFGTVAVRFLEQRLAELRRELGRSHCGND